MPPIFEKISDPIDTINLLSTLLYKRIFHHPVLRSYFSNLDMEVLARHQSQFLTQVLTTDEITEKQIKVLVERHKRLHIVDADFTLFIDIFQSCMVECDMSADVVLEVVEMLESFRKYIVDVDD